MAEIISMVFRAVSLGSYNFTFPRVPSFIPGNSLGEMVQQRTDRHMYSKARVT